MDITSRNGETDSVMEKPRSILLANGALLKHIQEWLGHSDFTTTANKYARLAYSSKITSAQAMKAGPALPESGDFGSRWEDVENG